MRALRPRAVCMERMQETTTGPQVTGWCCMRMAVLAFFGVPHGATDHLVAASIFRRSFPRCWLLVFVLVRKRAAVRLSGSATRGLDGAVELAGDGRFFRAIAPLGPIPSS